jgi:hypothetical protein
VAKKIRLTQQTQRGTYVAATRISDGGDVVLDVSVITGSGETLLLGYLLADRTQIAGLVSVVRRTLEGIEKALGGAERSSDRPLAISTGANDPGGAVPAISRSRRANRGKPWTADQEAQLLKAFDAGRDIDDIADAHGRTQGAITSRLRKLGRIQ